MQNRTLATMALSLVAAALTACGNVAGANTPAPPPELPPPPPLSAEAEARLAEPAPTVPAAPVAPAPQSALLLDEGFDGDLNGFTARDFSQGPGGPATWIAQDGMLAQAGDDLGLPDPGGTYLLAGQADWQDYSVTTQAFAQTPTHLGLVARHSDQGFYQLRLEAGAAASTLLLEHVDAAGSTHNLARAEAPATVGRWLTLRLTVRGTTISASLDDEVVVRAEDSRLARGQAGLYATADAAARFDNLQVEP